MYLIGDIHGEWQLYYHRIKNLGPSIQLGDYGHGIKNDAAPNGHNLLKQGHLFIRGNHDAPIECNRQENYLGDIGYRDPVFFISGGYSIYKKSRTVGQSWWEGEQLAPAQRSFALELYKHIKPRYVISHDAPTDAAYAVLEPKLLKESADPYKYANGSYSSRKRMGIENCVLSQMMQSMLEIHAPETWHFGHFHRKATFKLPRFRTQFTCVHCHDIVNAGFDFESTMSTLIDPCGKPYNKQWDELK